MIVAEKILEWDSERNAIRIKRDMIRKIVGWKLIEFRGRVKEVLMKINPVFSEEEIITRRHLEILVDEIGNWIEENLRDVFAETGFGKK
jgi:hypothetical protein